MCRFTTQRPQALSIDHSFLLSFRDAGEGLSLEQWASCRDVFSLKTCDLLTSTPPRPKPTKRSFHEGRTAGIRYELRHAFFTTNPRWFTRPTSSKEKLIHRSSLPDVSLPRLGLLNACSVDKRNAIIPDRISSSGLDFLAITETWLNVTHGDFILKRVCPPGYASLHVPRPLGLKTRGGGVGFIFRNSYTVSSVIPSAPPTSFELMDVSVRSSSKQFRLFIIYRPPDAKGRPKFSIFLSEFRLLLESSINAGVEVVIAGDFNIHVDITEDSKASQFLQLIGEMGWSQLVEGRTHKYGHTLDLILARTGSQFVTGVSVSGLITDHHHVLCSAALERPVREKKIFS